MIVDNESFLLVLRLSQIHHRRLLVLGHEACYNNIPMVQNKFMWQLVNVNFRNVSVDSHHSNG